MVQTNKPQCNKARLKSLHPLPLTFTPLYPQCQLPLPYCLVWDSKATPFPIREFQELEMTEALQPSPPTSAWTFLFCLPKGCTCFSRRLLPLRLKSQVPVGPQSHCAHQDPGWT